MFVVEFSIVSITVFVTTLNECVKKIASSFGKDVSKFIPIFSMIFGILLGITGYYLPNVEMGNNIVEAIFIGLSAGASATGCHQVYKQLSKEEEPNPDNEPDEPEDV